MKDLTLHYTDRSLPASPLQVRVECLMVQGSDLLVAPSRSQERVLPGTILLTARILQKPYPPSLLGLYSRVGNLGKGVPPLNGAVCLAGLELTTLGALVPPGTAHAVGGRSIDLSAYLALSPSVLDCQIKVISPGHPGLSLDIGGTPEQPRIDTSSLLFPVLLRAGGGVGSLVNNLSGAGMALGATTVGRVSTLGKGAISVVGSTGTGLLKTAKGLATADINAMAEGLKKTPVESVSKGAHAVVDTGSGIAEGAMDTGTASLGEKSVEPWRETIRKRWTKAWKRSKDRVEKMPFPQAAPSDQNPSSPQTPSSPPS